jgi:hypothetical protein
MDRNAFAAGIDDLLRDKVKARQMGENGLALVSEQYDFAKYVEGLESMFRRIIAARKSEGDAAKFSDEVPTSAGMTAQLENAV